MDEQEAIAVEPIVSTEHKDPIYIHVNDKGNASPISQDHKEVLYKRLGQGHKHVLKEYGLKKNPVRGVNKSLQEAAIAIQALEYLEAITANMGMDKYQARSIQLSSGKLFLDNKQLRRSCDYLSKILKADADLSEDEVNQYKSYLCDILEKNIGSLSNQNSKHQIAFPLSNLHRTYLKEINFPEGYQSNKPIDLPSPSQKKLAFSWKIDKQLKGLWGTIIEKIKSIFENRPGFLNPSSRDDGGNANNPSAEGAGVADRSDQHSDSLKSKLVELTKGWNTDSRILKSLSSIFSFTATTTKPEKTTEEPAPSSEMEHDPDGRALE